MDKDTSLLVTLGITGMIIGLAQLLASGDRVTFRVLIPRAITAAALGMSASAVAVFVPNLSLAATVGVCCVIASLGTSALEHLFQRVIK